MKYGKYTLSFDTHYGWAIIDLALDDGNYSGYIITKLATKCEAVDLMNKLNKAYMDGYMDRMLQEQPKVELTGEKENV